MPDTSVPTEWAKLADGLALVADAVRQYVLMPHRPWPDSISSRERAREDEFKALPYNSPLVHVQLAPLQYLGSSQDHLLAMAATIRTPKTVMAILTLLRTQLVGAAFAAYLADPAIDLRERVRRVVNCDLDSLTEQMRLFGRRDAESVAEYDRVEERRRELRTAARELGWHVTGNDTPRAKAWPADWYIAPKAKETTLLDEVLGGVGSPDRHGQTLYRYLSATSHAQAS